MNNYVRFFEAYKAPFLLESIYTYCYQDLNCFSLKENNNVLIGFQNIDNEKCKNDAIDLYENRYWDYYEEFNDFLDNADQLSKQYVSKKDLKKLIQLFISFLSYYRWTEFFYTDHVYNIIDNKIQKSMSNIKNLARKYLNRFFNGKNSYVNQIIKEIDNEEINNLTVNEILSDIYNIDNKTKNKRNNDHLLFNVDKLVLSNSKKYLDIKNNYIENNTVKGLVASKGDIKGKAFVLNADFSNYDVLDRLIDEMPDNCILVTETTAPDIIRACHKAIGIITNQGGIASHAAIISRELKIPCIVGTKNATKIIKTGDIIFMNGSTGEVSIE